MKCPNINSPEWKYMTLTFGEDTAWRLYIQNGEELPQLHKIDELLPAMNQLKTIVQGQNIIANQLLSSEAVTWYNGLKTDDGKSLSEIVPLYMMFNAFNIGDINTVAKWTLQGITLYKGSTSNDIYHEAFHAFTQLFMTGGEREGLYNEVRNKTGEFVTFRGNTVKFSQATNLEIEEYLAEEFQKFMENETSVKPKSLIRKLFDRLKEIISYLFKGTTFAQSYTDSLSNKRINELFHKLRIGNIGNVKNDFDLSFATTGLNKNTLRPVDKNSTVVNPLTPADYSEMMETIDYFMGDFIMSAFEMYPDTLDRFFKDINFRRQGYAYVLDEFKSKLESVEAIIGRYKTETHPTRIHNEKLRDKLKFIIDNFDIGTLDRMPTRGVVPFHLKFWEQEKDIAGFDNVFSDQRSGNEIDSVDYLNNQMRLLFSLIPKIYNENEIEQENQFGGVKLYSYKEVYNIINNLVNFDLENSSIKSMNDIYKVLLKYGRDEEEPIFPVQAVLDVLGDPNEADDVRLSYWMNLESTIGLPKNEIFKAEVILTRVKDNQEGSERVVPVRSNIRTANSLYNSIRAGWNSVFNGINSSELYTKVFPDGRTENQYNHEELARLIMQAGEQLLGVRTNEENFLTVLFQSPATENTGEFYHYVLSKLGVYLPNTKFLKQELTTKEMQRDIMFYVKEVFRTKDDQYKVNSFSDLLSNQDGRTNKFAKLALKYSFMFSNPGHETVEGNQQFEQNLASSLHHMVARLNRTRKFRDVVSNVSNGILVGGDMSHLHPDRNPWVTRSLMLRRAYNLPKIVGRHEYGRLMNNSISNPFVLEFADGLAVRTDVLSIYGVKNTNLEPGSKLIFDMIMMMRKGTSQAFTHGDKNTTPLISLEDGDHHISMFKFMRFNTKDDDTRRLSHMGTQEFLDQMMMYFFAETDRIIRAKNDDTLKNATVAGSNKTVQEDATKYLLFDGIIEEKLKTRLYEIINSQNFQTFDEFVEYFENTGKYHVLRETIEGNIRTWYNRKISENKQLINEQFLRNNNSYAEFVTTFIDGIIRKQFNNKFDQIKELNDYASNVTKMSLLDNIIEAFTANDIINKIEQSILIYGDAYNFNHKKDEFTKRIGAISSAGNVMSLSLPVVNMINNKNPFDNGRLFDGTLNTGVLSEPRVNSIYKDSWLNYVIDKETKRLQKAGIKQNVIDAKINNIRKKFDEAYDKMKDGDGQGHISLQAYRVISMGLNEWNNEKEQLFQKMENNESIDDIDVTTFFPVLKLQYYGPLKTEGLPLMAFHKFSLFPLLPPMIKDTNLETLSKRMREQNIDYVTFTTGSKEVSITKSGTEFDEFYSDNENSVLALNNTDYTFTPNVIFTPYLKKQIKVHDYYKGNVVFSTQFRKLVINSLWANGTPINYRGSYEKWKSLSEEDKLKNNYYKLTRDYENSIYNMIKYYEKELMDKASIDITNTTIGDRSKLIEYITDALEAQEVPDYMVSFIEEFKENLLYLDYVPSPEMIERVITSLIYKQLVNHRANGESLVQVSNVGFESVRFSKAESSRHLKSYRLTSKEVLPMEVKISIQGSFKHLLHQREVVEKAEKDGISRLQALNTLIKDKKWLSKYKELIIMTAVRIPVQGLNSMEYMIVEEFFPEGSGSHIVVPSEIVGKSGSDFDVDKLTVLMPNIYNNNGDVNRHNTKITTESLDSLRTRKFELRTKLKELNFDLERARQRIKDKKLSPEEKVRFNQLLNERNEKIKALESEYLEEVELAEMMLGHTDSEDVRRVEREIAYTIEEYKLRMVELRDDIVEEFRLDSDYEDIVNEINEINILIENISRQGLENDMLYSSINILKNPESFAALVTPNTTIDAKGVSDKLKVKRGLRDRTDITRIFETKYNINKLDYNTVGKQGLGIGALDNTANSLFNRIGMHLAGGKTFQSIMGSVSIDYTLNLDHNKTKDGFISLSQSYDVNNENNIADIISQLMNGWVDVAKDEWIFFLQGNRKIASSLLLLVQSGVPIETAGYFLSQPSIREFYDRLRFRDSAINNMYNKNPKMSWKGELILLVNELMGGELLDQKELSKINHTRSISNIEFWSKMNRLRQNIESNFKQSSLESSVNDNYNIRAQIPYLVEFAYVYEMANDVTKLKSAINFDTKKLVTGYDYVSKAFEKIDLERTGIPQEFIDTLYEESIISGFDVTKAGKNLFNTIFPNRNSAFHPSDYYSLIKRINNTHPYSRYDNREDLVNALRNGFISYMFQQNFYAQEVHFETGVYKGYELVASDNLERAVSLVDGKIYYDTVEIEMLLKKTKRYPYGKLFSDNTMIFENFSPIPYDVVMDMSDHDKLLFVKRYLVEREIQRSLPENSFENLSKGKLFQVYLNEIVNSEVFQEITDEEKQLKAYENYLRDLTLDVIGLPSWFFKAQHAFANRFRNLLVAYPELMEIAFSNYYIPTKMSTLSGTDTNNWVLRVSGNRMFDSFVRKTLNVETSNFKNESYVYQFLTEQRLLQNKRKRKVDIDPNEVREITHFFHLLPLVSFLQSGHKATDTASPYSVIEPKDIYNLLASTIDLSREYDNGDYIDAYVKFFNTVNSRAYVDFVLLEDYNETINYDEVDAIPERLDVSQAELELARMRTPIEQNFKDGSGGRRMQSKFKGKSTMDLIKSGDRTRTTRSKTFVKNALKNYGISEIDQLVGMIIPMVDKSGDMVLTRITGVFEFTQEYQDRTWQKEGWEKSVTDKLVGDYPIALEFELLNKDYLKFQPDTVLGRETKVIEGDIWESGGIPVITTNLGGIHGAGLANQAFKKKIIEYKKDGDFGLRTSKTNEQVVTFPVKKVWSDKTDLELLKDSAEKLIKLANSTPEQIYTLPLIGLGHGEGNVEEILPIIKNILDSTSNIQLILPTEQTDTGKKGTVRTDRSLEIVNRIKAELSSPKSQLKPTDIKVISEDYGVVQVETNPTEEQTEQFVSLIRDQIQKQLYKENKGKYANWMFHYDKMWARKNPLAIPIKIDSFDGGTLYAYHEKDQKGLDLPPLSDLQLIIDHIQEHLGIDMSDYDSMIGNLYLDGQYVYPHKDTSESKSARNYPVVVYTIGNPAGLGIVDNNKGLMTFANQYDTRYLPSSDKLSGYTNEVLTKNGTIYTFGMDGRGRFELTHSTPMNNVKMVDFPPITLPDGRVITKYTITLTFRRATDLTEGVPESPKKLKSLSTQPQEVEFGRSFSEMSIEDNHGNLMMDYVGSELVPRLAADEVLFINGAENDKLIEQTSYSKYSKLFNNSRVVRLDYRKSLKGTSKQTVWNDENYEENVKIIDDIINILVAHRDSGKKIIFDMRGYGHLMLGINENEMVQVTSRTFVHKSGSLVHSPIAPRTVDYLSQRLYDTFGYVNFRSNFTLKDVNLRTSLGQHISQKQGFSEVEIFNNLLEQIKACQ